MKTECQSQRKRQFKEGVATGWKAVERLNQMKTETVLQILDSEGIRNSSDRETDYIIKALTFSCINVESFKDHDYERKSLTVLFINGLLRRPNNRVNNNLLL